MKLLPKNDANVENTDGLSALHIAVSNGSIKIVKVMLEQKVDVNSKDNTNKAALHLAASNGHYEMAKIFAEK